MAAYHSPTHYRQGPPFRPLSPEFARDPYAAYAVLRRTEGLSYFADFEVWMASRFADVSAIVLDPRMVRSLEGIATAEELFALKRAGNWHDMPHHARFVQFSLLDSDGEVHDRLRRQVFKAFTPVMVARLRDEVQGTVDRLVAGLPRCGEIDFIEDFAAHVPGQVIGRVLGVPDEDCTQLRAWSENIVQFFDIDRSDERKRIAEANTTAFYEYLTALKRDRQREPKDDLISALIEAEHAGQLNPDELISTCMLVLMAGHGSTIDVLGSGLHALLRFPDQMARLRSNPGLARNAVQEMFRYEAPLPFFHRYCAEDITFRGVRFARGTKFGLLYGSANRDPEAFLDADAFDVGRTPNRHLAFGGGVHFCLGNHLARQNMEVIFTTLLQRFPSIELAGGEPEYKRGLSVRGPAALWIAVKQA
jgi:hypothetical protein